MQGKRRTPPDVALARLAERQHGRVSIRQLRALGIDRKRIEHRVRAGRLHPEYRGVYIVGRRDRSFHGRAMGAVLAIEGAVASHLTAAALYGLRTPRAGEEIHVTVARKVRQRTGIRVHCVRDLPQADVTIRDAIPLTTPARTLLDLAATLPPRQARRAVNEALVQRKVTLAMLERQARESNGHRGTGALLDLIADAAPTRSELEDMALAFLRRHGLEPEANVVVAGWEVDFLLAEHALVIEADGAQYHDNPLARERDARKQAALEAAGFRVERLTWRDVTRDEPKAARRLLAAVCAQAPKRAA